MNPLNESIQSNNRNQSPLNALKGEQDYSPDRKDQSTDRVIVFDGGLFNEGGSEEGNPQEELKEDTMQIVELNDTVNFEP